MILNGRDAIALVDPGASVSIVNASFIQGLGINLHLYEVEAELPDGRIAKSQRNRQTTGDLGSSGTNAILSARRVR